MIYTDSGRYAIRAMTNLASRPAERLPASAAEIADEEEIPPFYMAKVLQDLARADLLKSVRGRGGGFQLKRAADQIRVLEVLDAVENIRRLTHECILGLDECNDSVSCPLHTTWKGFRELLLARLEDMTVADLVVEMERKRRYLGLRRAPTSRATAVGVSAEEEKPTRRRR